jgi:hypothetical protein
MAAKEDTAMTNNIVKMPYAVKPRQWIEKLIQLGLLQRSKRHDATAVPSTYVSRTVGLAAGESSRVGLENFIEGDFNAIFEGATVRLKEENRYRTFVDLERIAGRLPTAIWHSKGGPREMTIWCSNDYLGMSQNPAVV